MESEIETPGPGRNVAVLRKQRDMSQVKLAQKARVSVSLLSKIEIGDRALTQGVAAALASAMGTTLDEVLGKAQVKKSDEGKLDELRSAIRRFDLPGDSPPNPDTLAHECAVVKKLVHNANLSGLIDKLPKLLPAVTNHAHSIGSPEAWDMVSGVYSAIYYLAARHRWMDLAELAVLRQKLAAERATPLTIAAAARDEAGAFLNSGDFTGGLAVVDRAIVRAETELQGREKALGLGVLHLRGLTLAGRIRENNEAERHIAGAQQAAEEFPVDVTDTHGIFGPENTAIHLVATFGDLEKHKEASELADRMQRQELMLPPTRIGNLYIDAARAKLALRDREGALRFLMDAWEAAPQKAKVHPTSQELLRVLISLHKRSNPALVKLAKKAGVNI
jgi:transcriptional regulator with XRE-family HTH domain